MISRMPFLCPLVHLNNGRSWISCCFAESFLESLEVEILSDENHLGHTFFVTSPRNVRWTEINLLMHPLEEVLVISLITEGEETLRAEEIWSLLLQQMTHEGVESSHIERSVNGESYGRHQRQVMFLLRFLLCLRMRVRSKLGSKTTYVFVAMVMRVALMGVVVVVIALMVEVTAVLIVDMVVSGA